MFLFSNTKPVLLLGASGMLGHAWSNMLNQLEVPFYAPSRHEFDLGDPSSIQHMFQQSFAAVINCAAYTDVDGAEASRLTAYQINANGVEMLAQQCAAADTYLVHHSTDYVFDGEATTPYVPTATCRPLNVYGHSKLAGEMAVLNSGCRHLILRTSWLYAPWGKNFVKTMAALLEQRPEVMVVDDQLGRPTSVETLAGIGWGLLNRNCEGLFHATDSGACTWYELAVQIRDELQADCNVIRGKTSELNRPALRPHYSVLDTTDTESLVGRSIHWQEGVRTTLERLSLTFQSA